ncbi:hypothetical protein A2U01_0068248, partial [Trifolium medium]|nr:hypothetical protein [Trifolium medium]
MPTVDNPHGVYYPWLGLKGGAAVRVVRTIG